MKCEKNKLQKIVGNLFATLRKLYMNGTGRLEIFSRPQVIENFRQNMLFRTDISQKTVVGCPCWLTSQNEPTVPLNKDWPKLLQKAPKFAKDVFVILYLIICNQDNSLSNSIKKTYRAYTLTELLKMEIWDVAYTKVTFWKFYGEISNKFFCKLLLCFRFC